jgi:hypothetical protein
MFQKTSRKMLISTLLLFLTIHSINSLIRTIDDCQLLIVGGTTSAFGAALSASKILNTRVCLIEPTDWVGGQLTAELLSAPDYAGFVLRDNTTNFTLNVGALEILASAGYLHGVLLLHYFILKRYCQ